MFASSDAALPDLTAAFYETLEGHLNNIATAVTNKKAILRKLVETNAFLAKLTAKKFERIEKLLLEANSAAYHGTPTPSTGRPAPSINRDLTFSKIHVFFKQKWVVGGFCSTNGWDVSPNYSSSSCGSKKPGHVNTATRKNPAGPGATTNKGWDSLMT